MNLTGENCGGGGRGGTPWGGRAVAEQADTVSLLRSHQNMFAALGVSPVASWDQNLTERF